MNRDPIDRFEGVNHFLSNYHEVPGGFQFEGIRWPTSEHAFNGLKTLDPKDRAAVLKADSPNKAKRVGRSITLRPGWNDIRLAVMARVLEAKFAEPKMATLLLATEDALLIEGNWWNDRFWGVDAKTGEGRNWLGRLLMVRRSELLLG